MLAKTSRLVIGKLLDPLVSDDRTGIPHIITSPKSPLEFKIRSPRCLKNCDPGVVGLSIVAALEKSSSGAGQIPVKFDLGSLNLNLSDPIPIGSSITSSIFRGGSGRTEMGCMATYNYVAAHTPNKSTFTGVHCDGGEDNSGDHDRSSFDRRCKKLCVSSNSPPRCINAIPAFPTSDFLRSCYLCRKKLHGRDIFMYRGEKAFCSSECRYKQIGIDERKEKCRSESSRPADVSGSPYTGGQLFSTGIIVA